MKKEKLPEFLLLISVMLVLAFFFRLAADGLMTLRGENSAPFWVQTASGAAMFLLPAAIIFAVSRFLKKRMK